MADSEVLYAYGALASDIVAVLGTPSRSRTGGPHTLWLMSVPLQVSKS